MTITTADAAARLNTTPRELRKFMRSEGSGVGKGSRYGIEKRDMRSLTSRFNKWVAANAPAVDEAPVPTVSLVKVPAVA